MTMATVGKTILACQEVGLPNVGVTIDFGHCLFGNENPAESVMLLFKYNKLFAIHINDNYGYWDDDLFFGSLHTIQALEFVYSLAKVKYRGWIGLDLFPYREDAVEACNISIQNFREMAELLDKLPEEDLPKAQSKHDAIEAFKCLRKLMR